jgi:hypothetical protein
MLQQRIIPVKEPDIWLVWAISDDPEEDITAFKVGGSNSTIHCKRKDLGQKQQEYEQLKKVEN